MKNASMVRFLISPLMLLVPLSLVAQQPSKGSQGPLQKPFGHTVTEIQSKGESENLESAQSRQQQSQMAVQIPDNQSLAILKAISELDLKAGELAEKKTENRGVEAIGQQAQKDQKDIGRTLENIEKKANLNPQANPLSAQLKQSSDEKLRQLQKLDEKKFEQAYLDYNIQFHKQALDIIDSKLLPNAKNSDLKQVLNKSRIAMLQHLQHSEYTRKTLNNPGMSF